LSQEYVLEYPWVIDELVFATNTKTLHIQVGIDLPVVLKVAEHGRPFKFLPCPKCGRKRCKVCGQGKKRIWFQGGLPVGGGLAVPTIVYGRAQMIECPDCGVRQIDLLQDLKIRANPNMPAGVRQMPTRPYVAKLVVRPTYTFR
jgi:predicted RNA-binding Zn-ribbon protein involved in translation (DUF1610 family)